MERRAYDYITPTIDNKTDLGMFCRVMKDAYSQCRSSCGALILNACSRGVACPIYLFIPSSQKLPADPGLGPSQTVISVDSILGTCASLARNTLLRWFSQR